uniref:Putative secreted protein n=1 Tax=Anopheles darlingi TaxID=43151 RepID=A0A2M4DG08_ANODA
MHFCLRFFGFTACFAFPYPPQKLRTKQPRQRVAQSIPNSRRNAKEIYKNTNRPHLVPKSFPFFASTAARPLVAAALLDGGSRSPRRFAKKSLVYNV